MRRFFVLGCGFFLLMGSWLFFQVGGWQDNMYKWQKGELRTLSEVGERQEVKLVEHLSDQKHPFFKYFSWLKLKLLYTPFIRKVEKGKAGWLFLQEEEKERKVIHQSLGLRKYNPVELKTWQLYFQQRAAWLAKRNIQYVLLFVPNKATVYPEYLPARYRKLQTTNLDQLIKALSNLEIIDLRDSLKSKKEQGQLYLLNDTHWNDLGAFYGHQFIVKALNQQYEKELFNLESISIKEISKKGGDLARLLLLDDELKEQYTQIKLLESKAQFMESRSITLGSGRVPKVYLNSSGKLPKTLFLHDSFLNTAIPFLAEHFQESIFLWEWQGFDIELIEREKPAVVVNQLVERSTIGTRKRNNWWVIQEYWQEHFQELQEVVLEEKLLFSTISNLEPILSTNVDYLPILQLQFELERADKLIVNYKNEKSYYPLWLGKNEIFLQGGEEIISIVLESGRDMEVIYQIRKQE